MILEEYTLGLGPNNFTGRMLSLSKNETTVVKKRSTRDSLAVVVVRGSALIELIESIPNSKGSRVVNSCIMNCGSAQAQAFSGSETGIRLTAKENFEALVFQIPTEDSSKEAKKGGK